MQPVCLQFRSFPSHQCKTMAVKTNHLPRLLPSFYLHQSFAFGETRLVVSDASLGPHRPNSCCRITLSRVNCSIASMLASPMNCIVLYWFREYCVQSELQYCFLTSCIVLYCIVLYWFREYHVQSELEYCFYAGFSMAFVLYCIVLVSGLPCPECTAALLLRRLLQWHVVPRGSA
jgi:hypothetical protein